MRPPKWKTCSSGLCIQYQEVEKQCQQVLTKHKNKIALTMIKKETVTPIDFLLVTVNFLFVVHNDILDNARENLHIRKSWDKDVKHAAKVTRL